MVGSKRIIYKNMLALGVTYVVNFLFPLLTWPLLARAVGFNTFGMLMLVFSLYSVANIVTDFGFHFSATYQISQNQDNILKINSLLGDIFSIKLILAALTCIVALPYVLLNIRYPEVDGGVLLMIAATILFQSLQCVWLFQGIEKMKYITWANLISKVLYLLVIVIVLPHFPSLKAALLCFLGNHILTFLLHFSFLRWAGFRLSRPKFGRMWREIRYGFSFFLARLSVSVYTSVNILLIGSFNGVAVAGLYGSAERLYGVGPCVANIVSHALYPHMAKTGDIRLLLKVVAWAVLPFVAVCVAAFAWAEEVMVWVFGADFAPAAAYLRLFLLLTVVSFLAICVAYPGFAAAKKVKRVNTISLFGASLHIGGLCGLYVFGRTTPYDVFYLTLCTELGVLCCYGLCLSKYHRQGLFLRRRYYRLPMCMRHSRAVVTFWARCGGKARAA